MIDWPQMQSGECAHTADQGRKGAQHDAAVPVEADSGKTARRCCLGDEVAQHLSAEACERLRLHHHDYHKGMPTALRMYHPATMHAAPGVFLQPWTGVCLRPNVIDMDMETNGRVRACYSAPSHTCTVTRGAPELVERTLAACRGQVARALNEPAAVPLL